MSYGYEKLSNKELADEIMKNADGRPLSDSFLRAAAIELARRITDEEPEPTYMSPKDGASNGAQESQWNWHSK